MNVKNVFYFIFIIMMIISFTANVKAAKSNYVVIDSNKESPFGAFDGWGTSLCWWANYFGDLPEDERKALVEAFFNTEKGLGLNIARYNIGGGDDPGHNHIRRDGGAVPGYLSADGKWNWDADKRQLTILKDAIANGVNIVEAFSNSPPYFMTVSGCASGGEDPNADNLHPDMYDDFADYLTEVTKYLISQGIKIDYLEPMNEPNTNYWKKNGSQEGCHISAGESQSKLILEVAKKLEEKGLSDIKISAMDETSVDMTIENINKLSKEALSKISNINTHTYGGQKFNELRDLAVKTGKKLYMSEVDGAGHMGENAKSMGPALWLSKIITRDLKELQAAAWIIWQVTGPSYPGDHSNYGYWYLSSYNRQTKTLNLFKKYYAFAQYTKFIRPGYYLIENSSPDVLTAYDKKTGKVVIVLTNTQKNEKTYTFDLSSFGYNFKKAEVYRTSNTQNLEKLDDIAVTKRHLNVSVPTYSITTFVLIPDKEPSDLLGISISIKDVKETAFTGQILHAGVAFQPSDYKNNEIQWSVSNTDLAGVSQAGEITLKKPGKVILYASLVSNPEIYAAKEITILDSNINVSLTSKASGKLLQPRLIDGRIENSIVQYESNDYSIQNWKMIRNPDGYYTFINKRTKEALTGSGDNIITAPCVHSENQQWELVQYEKYFALINRETQLCADVWANSNDNNAKIGLYSFNNTSNQLWKIEPVIDYGLVLESYNIDTKTPLTGKAFGTESYRDDPRNSFEKVFDGNIHSFFDAKDANNGYVGIDLGENNKQICNKIVFVPRAGFENRMIGGKFQGANEKDGPYEDIYTIEREPEQGENEVLLNNTKAYRYLRYLSPADGYCNIAEIKFFNEQYHIQVTNEENRAVFDITNYLGDSNITMVITLADSDGKIFKVNTVTKNIPIGETGSISFEEYPEAESANLYIISPSIGNRFLYAAYIHLSKD